MIVSPKATRARARGQRLVDAAAHHRRGAHAMRQPRQVDLLHHLLEAALDVADQIGDRALEPDFARAIERVPSLSFSRTIR